jgi:hypothetical protein
MKTLSFGCLQGRQPLQFKNENAFIRLSTLDNIKKTLT